jgi:hypothetical protein
VQPRRAQGCDKADRQRRALQVLHHLDDSDARLTEAALLMAMPCLLLQLVTLVLVLQFDSIFVCAFE